MEVKNFGFCPKCWEGPRDLIYFGKEDGYICRRCFQKLRKEKGLCPKIDRHREMWPEFVTKARWIVETALSGQEKEIEKLRSWLEEEPSDAKKTLEEIHCFPAAERILSEFAQTKKGDFLDF